MIFHENTFVDLVKLHGGTITVSDRADLTDVRMTRGILSGGSASNIAVLTIRDFTFSGGKVASAVTSKKRCYLNVTRSMTINGGSQVVDRFNILNYGYATYTSSSLSLHDDVLLLNTRKATLRLIHGLVTNRHGYTTSYT